MYTPEMRKHQGHSSIIMTRSKSKQGSLMEKCGLTLDDLSAPLTTIRTGISNVSALANEPVYTSNVGAMPLDKRSDYLPMELKASKAKSTSGGGSLACSYTLLPGQLAVDGMTTTVYRREIPRAQDVKEASLLNQHFCCHELESRENLSQNLYTMNHAASLNDSYVTQLTDKDSNCTTVLPCSEIEDSMEKASVKVAVPGLRDTFNDDANSCIWKAMPRQSEYGSLVNNEINICYRLPMSELDDEKLLYGEQSSTRVQMLLDDFPGTVHNSLCTTGESYQFDNGAIDDHQKMSAHVNPNLCNHDAVLPQLPLEEDAVCSFLCSSIIKDYDGVLPEVGHCLHPTCRDLDDIRPHCSVSGGLECAMWKTALEVTDVDMYKAQSNAVIHDVQIQDVLLDSLNSLRTRNVRSFDVPENVDQTSDRSHLCNARSLEINCGFAKIDNLLPDLLLPEPGLNCELEMLNGESSASVNKNVVHTEPDKSRHKPSWEEELEDGSATAVRENASGDINISVEFLEKNNHEEEAAVECALGLVGLAQSHNALSKTIDCTPLVENECVNVELGECQSFYETAPSCGTPINVLGSLTCDPVMSDSNNNTCSSERRDSCAQKLCESPTKSDCKVSFVAEPDTSSFAMEVESLGRMHLSTREFNSVTFGISRAVKVLNELLYSFNGPAVCDPYAGFISEQRCIPPLKARPSYVEPQFESSQPSLFKNLPKLIPKPGLYLPASENKCCLDSVCKNLVSGQLSANDVTIVNDALPVYSKQEAVLHNFQLNDVSLNLSSEKVLAHKRFKPLTSGLSVLNHECTNLLSCPLDGSVTKTLPQLFENEDSKPANESSPISPNKKREMTEVSSLLTCKRVKSSSEVSASSISLCLKSRQHPVSDSIGRKTALGLRSNPVKFRPYQIEQSRSSHGNETEESIEKVENCDTGSKKLYSSSIPCRSSSTTLTTATATVGPRQMRSRGQPRSLPVVGDTIVAVDDQFSLPRGSLVWARLGNQRWWPAMVIDAVNFGKSKLNHCCVFWFGDHKVSETSCSKVVPFVSEYPNKYLAHHNNKYYKQAMLEVVKEYALIVGHKLPTSLDEALHWAEKGFVVDQNRTLLHQGKSVSGVPEWVAMKLAKIRQQIQQSKSDSEETESSESDEESLNETTVDMDFVLTKVRLGELRIEDVCMACGKQEEGSEMKQHPFVRGGICQKCLIDLYAAIFVFEGDGISAYCVVCSNGGQVFVCETSGCNKVFCLSCIRKFGGDNEVKLVLNTNPWHCYMCLSATRTTSCLLEARLDWRENLTQLLGPVDAITPICDQFAHRPFARVLSLFDGIGTGRIVLCQLGIDLDAYFASEIDESAILVTRVRHGDAIQQIGCVKSITKDTLRDMLPIDLLIGGSPCNDLSLANPNRQGLEGDTGCLFYEYRRILTLIHQMNPPDRKLFWLFENVASMQRKTRDDISRHLDCQPAVWDAKHFSAMKRTRFFWGNLPDMYCPLQYNDKVNGASSSTLEEYLFPFRTAKVAKIRTITTKTNSLMQAGIGDDALPVLTQSGTADTLWIPEIERIFGFPEHYTDVANLSHCRRQKLLGQAWSIPVIRHLLSPLQNYFHSSLSISDQ